VPANTKKDIKMILQKTLVVAFVVFGCYDPAVAWDGTNTTTGSSVEIEQGQLVRSGQTIDVYDSSEGHKQYDVDSISRSGGTVEIEATESATGESTTLEMDPE
jgi:hypothetical protein